MSSLLSSRWWRLSALAAALVAMPFSAILAQGVTSGAIGGSVVDSANRPLAGAQVTVTNVSNGFRTTALTRASGRYLAPSLEVGGPYTVQARAIGYAPQVRTDVYVTISQTQAVDFKFTPRVVQLSAVAVTSTQQTLEFGPSRQGTQTRVSDSSIARLPNINRNVTDFIRAAPQVTVSPTGTASPGGQNNRFLNVQVDGASIANRFGLGGSPEIGAQVSGRGITMDAVKELQVVLTPFDVRLGGFTGALVNAVTKGGTNDFHGSLFYYNRDQTYGADDPIIRGVPFYRNQWGASVGGPILKDRLHFFASMEYQRQLAPAAGVYQGQPANFSPAFPAAVTQAQIDSFTTRFNQLYPGQGAGTLGQITNGNPLTNTFLRLDFRINDHNRLVVRNIYNDQSNDSFGRSTATANPILNFTSNAIGLRELSNSAVVQLYSSFGSGGTNELIGSYTRTRFARGTPVITPMLTVQNIGGGNIAQFRAGTENSSQGNFLNEDLYELTNNTTIPVGTNHRVTVGVRGEIYKVTNGFLQNSFGNWTFDNLQNFYNGVVNANTLYSGSGAVVPGANVLAQFGAAQLSMYAQDQWEVTPRLSVNYGLRIDAPYFPNKPQNQPRVDSAFRAFTTAGGVGNAFPNGFSTGVMPNGNLQFSPRIGFNYDISGNGLNQVRGGIGVFQGAPAYVWMSNNFQNSGVGLGQISCGGGNNASFGQAPAFTGVAVAPTQCGLRTGGAAGVVLGTTTVGTVNFADANLNFPQTMRAVLAFDRKLPFDLIASLEGFYAKDLNNLFYTDENMRVPADTARDLNGRTLYGILSTGAAGGVAAPNIVTSLVPRAIRISNADGSYQYGITGSLRKVFSRGWEGMAAYTYQRSFSITDLTSSVALSNWQFGRIYAGSQYAKNVDVSAFDQPHHVMLSGTWTTPSKNFPTAISLIYNWQSSTPFAYIAGGSGGRGDLNGDGSNANDPIYVPKNALDPREIQFSTLTVGGITYTPGQQAAAYEKFIAGDDCLNSQRGGIMTRNSCRNPSYATLDMSIRQSLPSIRGNSLSLEFQVFNVLNLMNPNWGKVQLAGGTANPQVTLVQQTGETNTGNIRTNQPIFTFDPNNLPTRYITSTSAFGFWRTQVGIRYSF